MRNWILPFAGSIVVAILGYGYWHKTGHASLTITAVDFSDRSRTTAILDANITLRNGSGGEVARFVAEAPYGAAALSQPERYACRTAEKDAPFSAEASAKWQDCFEQQSRWLSDRVRSVRYADVTVGGCQLRGIPVAATEWDKYGWLWWWVPLRHVGGKPYAYFSIHIGIDVRKCAIVNY